MSAVPRTSVRLTHALTIRSGRRIIGAIRDIATQQSRTIDTYYENETNARGLPIELIPQVQDTRTLRISRYDTYTEVLEEVFGNRELINLADQRRPFRIREVWTAPEGGLGIVDQFIRDSDRNVAEVADVVRATFGRLRAYEYEYCWFSDLGRQLSAASDRISMADATLIYRSRRRVV